MSTPNLHPTNNNCKQEPHQNEARAEFHFSDLPAGLQKELGKSSAKGVFLRASIVEALYGDCTAAAVLSQYVYWAVRNVSKKNPDGVFLISRAKIKKQIGLGQKAYDHAHARLTRRGFVRQVFNALRDRNVTINWQRLTSLLTPELAAQSDTAEQVTLSPLRLQGVESFKASRRRVPKGLKLESLRDSEEILSHSVGDNTASLVGEQGTKASNPPTIPQEEAEAGREEGNGEQGVEQLPQGIPAKPGGESTEVTFFQDRKNERNGVDTLIREFYVAIGQPKIPPSILKHGRKQVRELLKDGGYSLADVGAAITYVANGERDSNGRLLDQRSKPIGSIGYLSCIIAEAVEKATAEAEAEERLAREEAARQQEKEESDREALALAEEWKKNRPAWMSDSYYAWLLKTEAELPEKTQATEPAPAPAAPIQPAPVTVTPTPAPTVFDDSVGEGFAQAAA